MVSIPIIIVFSSTRHHPIKTSILLHSITSAISFLFVCYFLCLIVFGFAYYCIDFYLAFDCIEFIPKIKYYPVKNYRVVRPRYTYQSFPWVSMSLFIFCRQVCPHISISTFTYIHLTCPFCFYIDCFDCFGCLGFFAFIVKIAVFSFDWNCWWIGLIRIVLSFSRVSFFVWLAWPVISIWVVFIYFGAKPVYDWPLIWPSQANS